MHTDHIHRAVSADGTQIAAHVEGDGPPVVLVHGAFGGGATTWATLLPHLTDRFRCFALGLRGRWLSEPNEDHSLHRLVDDVVAVAESIGEPVGLIGLSSGALLSLGAAEHSDAVAAVAAYEPPTFELLVGELGRMFEDTIGRVMEAGEDDRLADAIEIFVRVVTNDDEFAAFADADLIDALLPNAAVQIREFPQVIDGPPPTPTDPQELARITAPVLLLKGTRSEPGTWFPDGIRHCAEHIRGAQVATISGAGHLGPILQPELVASAVIDFFAETLQPA